MPGPSRKGRPPAVPLTGAEATLSALSLDVGTVPVLPAGHVAETNAGLASCTPASPEPVNNLLSLVCGNFHQVIR
jgi:hypothetical protein